jgi:hypothetical protein
MEFYVALLPVNCHARLRFLTWMVRMPPRLIDILAWKLSRALARLIFWVVVFLFQ